jgi:predicted nucleic acid-binding protein
MINPHGTPGKILDLIAGGTVDIAIDDRIFSEYCSVLERPRFSRLFSDYERMSILEFIKLAGIHARTSRASVVITDLPDKGDIPFLEIALSMEIPLVTGNLKHFPKSKAKGCKIMIPSDFINLYRFQNRDSG